MLPLAQRFKPTGYEIWDIESGNRMHAVSTMAEALAFIDELLELGYQRDRIALLGMPATRE